jgi:hypothetical protein
MAKSGAAGIEQTQLVKPTVSLAYLARYDENNKLNFQS